MFVFVGKIFLPLAQPLGFAFILWTVAVVCYWRGRRRVGRVLAVGGMVVVMGFGHPWVGGYLYGGLEDDFAVLTLEELPDAEAIVVLGGMTSPPIPPRREVEVGDSFDRLLHGMRLLRAGKAPFLVLSGGGIASLTGSEMTEASRLEKLALEYGIDPEAVILEEKSRNTYENGLYVRDILRERGCKKVLLVTSAGHMRRSVGVFRTLGMEVIPAPTDVRVVPMPFHLGRLLPSVLALEYSSRAVKEHVGWWIYRMRGWVD